MSHDAARWERIKQLYEDARPLAAGERAAFLEQACTDDPTVRAEVQELLAVEEGQKAFLEDSPAQQAEWLADAPGIPERIGSYRILRRLAHGGMGTVFEARQDKPQRPVAVKMMRAGLDSPGALRRFEYESQVLAHLTHPGIAQVYEVGTFDPGTGPVPWFSMELVAGGRAITTHAQDEGLSQEDRLTLFAKVCEAVHHGHTKGVIHRDLKPSNILVGQDGRPKIIDFGVARSLDPEFTQCSLDTQTGQLIGTLQYMSPEQCRGEPTAIDTRSDVYALGVVLHELLAGQTPYDLTPLPIPEAARVVCEEMPRRPSAIHASLRGDLETIVLKAMEKEPARRYQSALALAEDLRRFLGGEAIQARPASAMYQLRVLARRHRALAAAAAIALVALTGGLVAVSVGWFWATTAEAHAKEETAATRAALDFFDSVMWEMSPSRRGGEEPTYRAFLDQMATMLDEGSLAQKELVESFVRSTVAAGYQAMGQYQESEEHYAAAVELRRQATPEDLRALSRLQRQYAMALRNTGRQDEAEPILEQVLATYDTLGLDGSHLDVRSTWNALGNIYLNQKRLGKAEQMYRRLLDADPDNCLALVNIALAVRIQGRTEEAADLSRRAVRACEDQDNQLLYKAYADLAMALGQLGDTEEALRFHRLSAETAERRFGRRNPETMSILEHLARALSASGDPAAAEPLLREAIGWYQETVGPRATDTANTRRMLGDCLTRQERFEEAEEELLAAHDILLAPSMQSRGYRHPPPLTRARWGLAALYEAWGRPEEAARWQEPPSDQQ